MTFFLLGHLFLDQLKVYGLHTYVVFFTNSLRLAFLIIIDLMPHLAGASAIAGLKARPCPFIPDSFQILSKFYPDKIRIKSG